MMNIYDCFQYFDEDLLLDIRLNVLNQYVKKFVITEATYTHNGAKKELNFNINNFKKFKDKINYLVIDQPPTNLLEFVTNEPEREKGEKLILICDDPDVQYDIPKLANRMSSELIEINEENGVWKLSLLAA